MTRKRFGHFLRATGVIHLSLFILMWVFYANSSLLSFNPYVLIALSIELITIIWYAFFNRSATSDYTLLDKNSITVSRNLGMTLFLHQKKNFIVSSQNIKTIFIERGFLHRLVGLYQLRIFTKRSKPEKIQYFFNTIIELFTTPYDASGIDPNNFTLDFLTKSEAESLRNRLTVKSN